MNVADTAGHVHHLASPADLVGGGAWQHVAATYDKASGTGKLFYNGVMVANLPLGVFTPNTGFSLYLGHRPAGSYYPAAYFRGAMDEVGIYNRALSTTEIQAIYAAGSAGKCASPVVTNPPRGTTAFWGATVLFSVGVKGDEPFTYQWYREAFPISWGTNATLTLTDVDLTAAGNYWVAVSNAYGGTASTPALLVVNPAGVWLGTHPFLTITGTVGKTFGIEYTTAVSQTNAWTALTNLTLTQPVQEWIDTSVNAAATPQRFYRVISIP